MLQSSKGIEGSEPNQSAYGKNVERRSEMIHSDVASVNQLMTELSTMSVPIEEQDAIISIAVCVKGNETNSQESGYAATEKAKLNCTGWG